MRFRLCIARRATTPPRCILASIIALIAVTLAIPLATADARRYAIQTEASELGFQLVMNRCDYGMSYNSFVNPIGNEVRVSFTIRARAS